MGITVFRDKADSSRSYLRVTRAVDGEEQQHYVRVNGSSRKAMSEARKEAEDLDAELARWQADRKASKAASGELYIHERGHILGLQLQRRQREGRKDATEFKLRVKPDHSPAVYSSVSVDRYGFDDAFERAITRLCEVRGIDREGQIGRRLAEARPLYRERLDSFGTAADATTENQKPAAGKKVAAESSRQSGILGQLRGWVKRKTN